MSFPYFLIRYAKTEMQYLYKLRNAQEMYVEKNIVQRYVKIKMEIIKSGLRTRKLIRKPIQKNKNVKDKINVIFSQLFDKYRGIKPFSYCKMIVLNKNGFSMIFVKKEQAETCKNKFKD